MKTWCSYCKKAKAFFRSRGIEFTEYDVEKDQAAAQRMQALTKSKSVPFAVINGHSIQGYSTAAYEKALSN
jgi:glutaredoxin